VQSKKNYLLLGIKDECRWFLLSASFFLCPEFEQKFFKKVQ